MDINTTIQSAVGFIFWLLNFIMNHFLEVVILAMIIYVIYYWPKIKALWGMIYAKVDKQMDVPFKRVETMLKLDREASQ